MTELSYIEKGNISKFELTLPVSYSKSSMKNGDIVAQDLKLDLDSDKQSIIISVEMQVTTKAMVTAKSKEAASAIMKKTGEPEFSEVSLSKPPVFLGLKGNNGSTSDAHKFHKEFIADATKIAVSHIASLNKESLVNMLSTAKQEPMPTKCVSVKPSFAKKFKESAVHIETKSLNNQSRKSELHLEYDGGKKQPNGLIKLYGLRKPNEKTGRTLQIVFNDKIFTALSAKDDEKSICTDSKENSTCIEVKTQKGAFQLNLLCQETLAEITALDKVCERTNLSDMSDNNNSVTYALSNYDNVFSRVKNTSPVIKNENINSMEYDPADQCINNMAEEIRREVRHGTESSPSM